MSRILFAAARNARIQRQWLNNDAWHTTTHFIFESVMHEYRIHPDDEHLQYGPVSTALREMAEDPALWTSKCWKWSVASSAADEFNVYLDAWRCEPDYPLFYLFLAEFLADEGM